MTYNPREFWEARLSEHFDLRGTGETGLSLGYNRACYRLRLEVLEKALAALGFDPRGKRVLDVGCGTGFFTDYYLQRGADLTGVDIAATSVERLSARFPQARFVLADVSEVGLDRRYDLVNAFDVLYHITDDARWQAALTRLADAVERGGLLVLTDVFSSRPGLADHNRTRPLARYLDIVRAAGLEVRRRVPTHVLLNRELGAFRFLNRAPGLLLAADRALLGLGLGDVPSANQLLVARRLP